MADMYHFENYSLVDGTVRAELRLSHYSDRFRDAQEWLGYRVLEGCKPYMPFVTGGLQQRSYNSHEPMVDRSYVSKGGREVVFPGPYARYLYMGKVMVDSVTGKGPRKIPTGPGEYILRFRKDATLVPTGRPLTYTRTFNPKATDHWFDHAKAKHGQEWITGLKRRFGGR